MTFKDSVIDFAETIGLGLYIVFCIVFFPLAILLRLIVKRPTLEELLEELFEDDLP